MDGSEDDALFLEDSDDQEDVEIYSEDNDHTEVIWSTKKSKNELKKAVVFIPEPCSLRASKSAGTIVVGPLVLSTSVDALCSTTEGKQL